MARSWAIKAFEKDVVERIRESRLAGNTHFMIVVAEGAGSAVEIGKRIQETVGIDPRVTVLGHIQRGGSPTARDRETASRMGYACLLYTSPSPRDRSVSRMPSSA